MHSFSSALRAFAPLREILLLTTLLAVVSSIHTVCGAADVGELERAAFQAAAEHVADSVVQIRTIGGLAEVDDRRLGQGPTTGLIVDPDGYVVSSAFNFAQQPSSILVRLPDGSQRPAEIVGRDTNRMLVLLKVDADGELPVPEPAPIYELRVGDWTVAVGRTYDAEHVDLSVGVVSALNRMYGRVVQTDASVSPSNYGGPLVDVRGRVIGVLAPFSPELGGSDEPSAVAGSEFYDSGIGFAVPLEDVLAVLPRWKREGDLKRGLLGVGFVEGGPHATRPEIAAVWPGSPASKAGWKKGDLIVEAEGKPVATQAELRFKVVPRYAGDTVAITIRRGEGDDAEKIRSDVELAASLEKYRHAFLGVLPVREMAEPSADEIAPAGIAVRAVWPESPVDKAGLLPGDRITALGDKKVASIEAALAELTARYPGDSLAVSYLRGNDDDSDKPREASVKLAALPANMLSDDELHPPDDEVRDDAETADPVVATFAIPEFPQLAHSIAPASQGPAPALVIWLGDGKQESAEQLADQWRRPIARDRVTILAPAPADKVGWSLDDAEYLSKLIPAAISRLAVDPRRVAIVGEGKAGQFAYLVAFQFRRQVRGVATIDAPLPRAFDPPATSPAQRLAILSIDLQNSPLSILVRSDMQKLRDEGYPVSVVTRRPDDGEKESIDPVTRETIARWLDGLDRF